MLLFLGKEEKIQTIALSLVRRQEIGILFNLLSYLLVVLDELIGDKQFARGQENRDKNEKLRQVIEEIENQDKFNKDFARQFTTRAGE